MTNIKDPKPGTPEFEFAYNRMVATWSRCYTEILKTTKSKQRRLEELLTWDKPKDKDKYEWAAKVTALEGLLSDTIQKPIKK